MNASLKNTECPLLFEACTLSLYQKNIFRVTGLPVDATSKEVARQAQKLQMLEEMGGGSAGPQPAFPLAVAPTSDEIRAALSRMKEPEHRIIDEFFWYWPEEFGASKSDPAIQSLLAGDATSAIQLWQKREKEGSSAAMHNIAIMYHMYAVDWTNYHASYDIDASMEEEIKACWRKAFDGLEILIDSEEIRDILKDRIRSVDDDALTTGFVRRLFTQLPNALDQINALAALKMAEINRMDWATFHVNFMNETHQGLDDVDSTAEIVLAPTKARVEELLETFSRDSRAHPEMGADLARKLLSSCRPMMSLFDLFHGKEAHQSNDLFDKVAETILGMTISHQRATGDNATFVAILNESLKFTSSKILRERIENYISVNEKKTDQEILLKIINKYNSFDKNIIAPNELLIIIKNDVIYPLSLVKLDGKSLSETYINFSNYIAVELCRISIDSWNSYSDYSTAKECLDIASNMAKTQDVRIAILRAQLEFDSACQPNSIDILAQKDRNDRNEILEIKRKREEDKKNGKWESLLESNNRISREQFAKVNDRINSKNCYFCKNMNANKLYSYRIKVVRVAAYHEAKFDFNVPRCFDCKKNHDSFFKRLFAADKNIKPNPYDHPDLIDLLKNKEWSICRDP
jgi:hypothetical protein